MPAPAGPRCIGASTWMSRGGMPNLRRDPPGDQVDHPLGGGLGLVGGEQEEVGVLAEHRGLAGVDPVRVDHHPGLLGLPEDLW